MLCSELLFESPENDVAMAQVADHCAMVVSRALYSGIKPDAHIDLSGHGEFLVWDLWRLGLSDYPGLHDVCIMLGAKRPETIGLSGAVYTFGKPLFDRYNRCVVVNGLSHVDVKAVKSLVNGTKFIEVCAHEFMHVFDALRSPMMAKGKSSAAGTDKRAYYNDPAEFNAYYHDIVSEWTAIAKAAHSNEGRDYAELCDFSGNFKTDLKRVRNKNIYTSAFMKWLTDARRKALLKRMYKLHGHVVELLAQERNAG